ncbi:hypothetical protein J6590_038735 [Homalodisca vitripennis]|nr:hypothetical protein J6590_038735 [Homalodisca vitripennis]
MALWPLLFALVGLASAELEVVNQWNLFDFDIPYGYPTNENYSTSQSPSTGLEVGWDRLFLALPRFMPGAPLSLAFIPRNQPGGYEELSPKLQPYPSWDWHRDASAGQVGGEYNCTGLVSVFRARLDRCNRLWVLDSGVLDSLVNFRVACPPKILIFDLTTDTLVRSITMPPEVLRPNTLLTNLALDDQNDDGGQGYGSCDNIYVYMSDTTNPGIVVYDARRDSAWRLGNPAFFPEPDWGTFRLAGEYFTLMDGIIGLALSPAGTPDRTLYLQAFASNRIYSIPTSALRAGPNSGDDSDLPVSLVGHKSSQAAPLAVDIRDGSLVFCPVSETALAAWTPGSSDHRVLAHDPDQLQFVLDIRSAERDRGILWVVSTRLQKFLKRTINSHEVNLRILRVISGPNTPSSPPGPFGNFLHFKK